jgi:hypothetical protein
MKTHSIPGRKAEKLLTSIVPFRERRNGCDALHTICSRRGKYGIRVGILKVSKAA